MVKSRRLFCFFMFVVIILTISFSNKINSLAATGSKTVKSTGSMSIVLSKGQTGDSSTVSFNVSGLPANASVTKIVIKTGTLTYNGAMGTNFLTLKKSGSNITDKITWRGAANTELTAKAFKATPANGTYTISFNCTCLGGAIINGVMSNVGTKTYKSPSITIYWDDTL